MLNWGPPEGAPGAVAVVAGTDPVAVDAHACTLLGLRPENVAMIAMAAAHGLGQIDTAKLVVRQAVS